MTIAPCSSELDESERLVRVGRLGDQQLTPNLTLGSLNYSMTFTNPSTTGDTYVINITGAITLNGNTSEQEQQRVEWDHLGAAMRRTRP